MAGFVRPAALPSAKTLESKWYVSDDIFRSERERIFVPAWVCVGRADRIARPGEYFLADVAGESLIVARDENEAIHAFYNVCRHRGTRLCVSDSGTFKSSIQCPYHAWTYGLDGRLRVARNMEEVEGFEKTDYSLHEAAVATFEGFIFLNLAREPEPFDAAYAPLIGRFASWNVANLRPAQRIVYDIECNWKLVFLNYSECYHCPLVHPQLEKLSPSDSGRNDLIEGPFLGGYSEMKDSHSSLSTSGKRARDPVGSVGGGGLSRVYYYTIFPSLLLSLHPDYVMAHYVQPIAPNKTRVTCEWLFEPGAMQRDDFDSSDVVDFWDLTNRQDWRVNELTQLGTSSRAHTPGPYAPAEGLLHAFDRHYCSVMTSNL
jgi:Rieske 2Fe-2S family protein